MRGFIIAAVGLAPFAILASCSSFGASSSSPETNDAATPDAAPADITTPDGAVDAGAADACTALIDDDFTGSELGSDWIVGGGQPTVEDGGVVLLDGTYSSARAIWHRAVSPSGSLLRIAVELHASAEQGALAMADGLAIAWAPAVASDPDGTFLTKTGESASHLAICSGAADASDGPFGALALGVETFYGRLELLDQLNPSNCVTNLPDVTITETMPAMLQIRSDLLTGSLAGSVLTRLPRAVDVAWVGFTASSGPVTSREAIAHVHVSSCP